MGHLLMYFPMTMSWPGIFFGFALCVFSILPVLVDICFLFINVFFFCIYWSTPEHNSSLQLGSVYCKLEPLFTFNRQLEALLEVTELEGTELTKC